MYESLYRTWHVPCTWLGVCNGPDAVEESENDCDSDDDDEDDAAFEDDVEHLELDAVEDLAHPPNPLPNPAPAGALVAPGPAARPVPNPAEEPLDVPLAPVHPPPAQPRWSGARAPAPAPALLPLPDDDGCKDE
ncbi:hypothetical protein FOA52_004280 [Chlamydomonas sp. UWO 241]|nr:hypothetical protein FOA52_004280 [Chlamydomonas sp. UWO 241]